MTHDGDTLAATEEVNQAQREHWEHEGARLYRSTPRRTRPLIGPFGQAMFDAAHLEPGEVCSTSLRGFGASTLEAEERVGPTGRVVGVDISAAMLEGARRRVVAAGLDGIELVHADAQVHEFQAGSFDAVTSRFGLMFSTIQRLRSATWLGP